MYLEVEGEGSYCITSTMYMSFKDGETIEYIT